MRFPPANVQLRRAQLILMLAVLIPTVLMTVAGIVLLVINNESAASVVVAILVLTLCTSAITGYILGALFVGKGASLVRTQSDFISSVSHELRTPLTSIRLFLESLRDGRLPRDDQEKVVALLGTEIERLDGLVLRMLEVSRMEAGRHPFERLPVAVKDLVNDAIASFDAATLSRPTPIEVEIEPGLTLVGDRSTLSRAIANLLINAWKYTGEVKRIRVDARRIVRHFEITVSDNGIGVGRAEQVDIFEEFSRGRGALDRGISGVGLGLALVRAIVRAHKGTVLVSSRPGEGSSFKVRLPARKPRPEVARPVALLEKPT